jgi:mono/diheme cytochrome c family protein
MKELFALIVAGLSLAACSASGTSPDDDGIHAVDDPGVVDRGRYLVYGPAHCAVCHGDPQAPYSEDVPLSGGRKFDLRPLGTLSAPNITSDPAAGIGALSDATLVRSLRYGISRDGRPLAPLMPFADLSDDDLQAVLSYLRTVGPAAQPAPNHDLTVLGRVALKLLKAQGPTQPPPITHRRERTADYGRYLAHTVASCYGCHTQRSELTGEFIGPPFAGGMTFEENGQRYVSPNLTTAAAGRLSGWSEQQFIDYFRAKGALPNRSPMPWNAFARMTDDDLGAIYRYLNTTEPAETPR